MFMGLVTRISYIWIAFLNFKGIKVLGIDRS
jgi:hypothetical protein